MNTYKAAQAISKDSVLHIISEDTIRSNRPDSIWVYAKGTEPLRATICWADRPGTPPPVSMNPTNKMLVNDLDLRVTDTASSTTHLPWKLNRAIPAAAATKGDNDVDNVEQVLVSNPVAGWHKIKISHKGALTGSLQAYSLIISGITTADTSRLCKNTMYFGASSGTFDDGSGNLNYKDNADCSWGVLTDTNTVVSISFTQFNVAAGDTVRIYGGANRNAPLLAKYSGTALPAAVISPSRRAFVTFTSNSNGAAAGWMIKYGSVIKPAIDFTPTNTKLCENETVSFNSVVTNTDTVGVTWNWTFSGGQPATFVGRKPYVKYPQAGAYNVTATATNNVGSTVLTKTNVVTVAPDTALHLANFYESFETATFPNVYTEKPKNWTVTTANSWQRSTVQAKSGLASLRITNGGAQQSQRELIAPMVNVKGNTALASDFKVYFWRNYNGTSGSDILRLSTSTNCGKSWQQRYMRQGTTLNTNGQWVADSTINLAGLLVPNLWVRFTYEGNGNGIFYLDSVLIGKPSTVTGIAETAQQTKLQVVPNPFATDAQILLSLEKAQNTRWWISDVLGKMYADNVAVPLTAGEHQVKISDLVKTKLPAGMYWLRVQTADQQIRSVRMMVQE
jgi:PKD repeat protein